MSQAIGSGAVVLATIVVAAALMYAVKATGTLRVSERGELEGLDLHEHGMVAYPEYVIHGFDSSPRHEPGAGAPAAAPARVPVPART
jgi:Amt family ammonium transporter